MTESYRTLYDSWRRERQRPDIQPLPEGFHQAMAGYVTQLREQSRAAEKTSVRGKLIEKEREHAERMLQDINHLRLTKLVTSELNGAPVEPLNLTTEEKRLQVEMRRLLAAHTQGLKQAPQTREPAVEAPPVVTPPPIPQSQPPQPHDMTDKGFKVVRLTQPLPAIMGVDMKTYGPFKAEDVASLPAQNADNLIRKGIAKLVEIEP
jgi:DNA replication factor GINS